MEELTTLIGIQHDRSTPYHHESLGIVERSHKTLNEYIRSYMVNNKDWLNLVKSFEYCYNTTPNTSINLYTPFEIVYGRIAPSLIFFNQVNSDRTSVNDYIVNLKNNMELVHKNTHEFISDSKIKTKLYYDKSANPINVNVGDNVLHVNEIRSKFDPLYKDNYVVKEIIGQNVRIENVNNGKSTLVHKNRIRYS